ncbi:MAG: outer membrane beta-barrel protein [Flavobacteriaceae bacterium]|jgi:hypothetical protein
MKKLVLTVLTLTLTTTISFAQMIDFGAKAGLNYNFGGDLSEVFQETGDSFENVITGADNKAGFHVGLWTKIHVLGFYIRPEVVYTELNNSYNDPYNDIPEEFIDTDLKTKKVDIPILIGAKVAGPLHIFGGPSFQYISKTNFNQAEFENIKTKDFTAGLQLGAGLEFGRLGIDVRWEKGFENDVDGEFLNSNIRVDNRPNQIIFGLSYRFNDRSN